MIPEEDMLPLVSSYFGEEGYHCYPEVSFLSRRVDMIGTKKGEIVAVELKVKDWKRALQQAVLYRICAHRVYVAMWHEYVHRADVDAFAEYGIGLMDVNGKVEIKLRAKRSPCIHESQLKTILREIKRRAHGH